jgi:excisionase family DNA binding protein
VPLLALSMNEAAEALSVSRDLLDRHIRQKLRVIRRGRKVLVAVRELERWLDQNAALTLDLDPVSGHDGRPKAVWPAAC